MVRSVPGPCSRRASKRRFVRRSAFDFKVAVRSTHAFPGSSASSLQTCATASHSLPSASSGSRSGYTSVAQSGVGTGTIVQFVVRRLTTSPVSGRYGSRSRPARAGSSPSSACGACGPERRNSCRVLVGQVQEPLRHPRWRVVERVLGRVGDSLSLDPLIEGHHVDVLRSPLVRRAGDPPGDLLLAHEAGHGDELPLLDVRAEDGELGQLIHPCFDLTHSGRQPSELAQSRIR